MRRDQWRRFANPLLEPIGELVIPRQRLCHAVTLVRPATSRAGVRGVEVSGELNRLARVAVHRFRASWPVLTPGPPTFRNSAGNGLATS
jgi:hypothetical protein